MDETIDRRQFLSVSAACAIAAVTTSACAVDGDAQGLAPTELLSVLGRDVVRDLGERYRAMVPAENDAARLRAAITGSQQDTSPLSRSAESRIKSDFENGRTVVVDGWLLSATEARQCALYSLRT